MKLDFNKKLIDLEGNPVNEQTLGKSLAALLVNGAKGDILKFYDWAKTLHAGNEIDLDRADQAVLKQYITDSEHLTILAKAQMLEVFEKKQEDKTNP